MVFPTLQFAIFFALLLAALLVFRRSGARKLILLVSSWIFYMAWNPSYIWILLGLCFVDFFVARALHRMTDPRRRWILLVLSMVANLGMLAYFKYTHFLSDSLLYGLHALGIQANWELWAITLPIGISFHTFQSMSYTIDVYRREIPPCENLLDFLLFVAFFPQLVAGPIVRAVDFLPQLKRPVVLRFEPEALLLIGSGLLKKVVVADNLAPYVDAIVSAPQDNTSIAVFFASLCFYVQVYCDFSGYSEIAIGVASLLGYWFPQNFNRPLFATNSSDFWRRWHISLSTWLRDYLYIPLGGNRGGDLMMYRNLVLTMVIGGIWHGAGWNYIIWGFWMGLLLVLQRIVANFTLSVPWLSRLSAAPPGRFFSWLAFQWSIVISFMMFRITNSHALLQAFRKVFVFDGQLSLKTPPSIQLEVVLLVLFSFMVVHTLEYFWGIKRHLAELPRAWLIAFVVVVTAILCVLWPSRTPPFVYFQF